MRLACEYCGGSGEGYYGGEECTACDGSGTAKCDAKGCNEEAVVTSEDGDMLCEDCFSEWACRVHARS